MSITLHNYFRSSASYRVRIALNLKGLPYDYLPVHLNRDGGQQFKPPFTSINPQALVPVIEDGEVRTSQSMAILEYLEERYPTPPLLPTDLADRAYVRRLSQYIACDIHPLQNLRVLKFLTGPLHLSEEAKQQWLEHWISVGLAALERDLVLSGRTGRFCFGDAPTLADCCLMPQVFSARRFGIDMGPYPTITAIETACNALEGFQAATPGRQPDAE